jgi:hypothetical protein
MTTFIVVSIFAAYAAMGALCFRLCCRDECVIREPTFPLKQRLSDSVVLVSRAARQHSTLSDVEQQLEANLGWTPKPCGFRVCLPYYQAL